MKSMIVAALLCAGLMVGCKEEGPMERAGEDLDRAAKDAGKSLERAGEKTGDAVKDAGEKIQDASK